MEVVTATTAKVGKDLMGSSIGFTVVSFKSGEERGESHCEKKQAITSIPLTLFNHFIRWCMVYCQVMKRP